ncbi:hypothetical protein BT96DRAFT_994889 [Gymnopus androsaceus JB14]|uniref:Fatty acid synthase beta subunit AflB /Fas1-like central domain-containing protein n=1 Tax=Gymnopus androsaceus JB14 TaxID=1447944 RepID=A0A6A4HLY0_9AGAR|nr:hypothetical protein BT96DRAFT_994889 [Gymnopus androsaceus JB14]
MFQEQQCCSEAFHGQGQTDQGHAWKRQFLAQSAVTDAGLYNSTEIKREENWAEKIAPRLVKSKDGTIHLDTPFSCRVRERSSRCWLTTSSWLVADTTTPTPPCQGYRNPVENSPGCRNHPSTASTSIPLSSASSSSLAGAEEGRIPHRRILHWHGVPSTKKAAEIIEGLRSAGIKHLGLKPGSVDGIRQVINIAAANPDFPIIMQWTGGRAGGHHSFEDFHQPIFYQIFCESVEFIKQTFEI